MAVDDTSAVAASIKKINVPEPRDPATDCASAGFGLTPSVGSDVGPGAGGTVDSPAGLTAPPSTVRIRNANAGNRAGSSPTITPGRATTAKCARSSNAG